MDGSVRTGADARSIVLDLSRIGKSLRAVLLTRFGNWSKQLVEDDANRTLCFFTSKDNKWLRWVCSQVQRRQTGGSETGDTPDSTDMMGMNQHKLRNQYTKGFPGWWTLCHVPAGIGNGLLTTRHSNEERGRKCLVGGCILMFVCFLFRCLCLCSSRSGACFPCVD